MYFIRGLTDKLSFSPCLEQVIRRLNIIGLWNFFKVSSQIYFYSFLYMSQKLEVMSSSAFLLEIVLHYRTIVPIEKSLVMHASLSSFFMVSCLSVPLLLLLDPSDFFSIYLCEQFKLTLLLSYNSNLFLKSLWADVLV